MDPVHRPGGTVFLHRLGPGDVDGNGLIGQAWTVLGLSHAFRVLGWEELRQAAEHNLISHPFDPQLGSWSSQTLTGMSMGVNVTLNQQVWFAAAAASLASPPAILSERLSGFLTRLSNHVCQHNGGLIAHLVSPLRMIHRFPVGIRSSLRSWMAPGFKPVDLAVGYHSFVLHGLAMLHQARPAEPYWDSRSLKAALAARTSEPIFRSLDRNQLAYGYNPTGI